MQNEKILEKNKKKNAAARKRSVLSAEKKGQKNAAVQKGTMLEGSGINSIFLPFSNKLFAAFLRVVTNSNNFLAWNFCVKWWRKFPSRPSGRPPEIIAKI